MDTTLERINEACRHSGYTPPILSALRSALQAGRVTNALAERCLDAWEQHRTANGYGFTPAAYLKGEQGDFLLGDDGTYVEAKDHRLSKDLTNSYRADSSDFVITRLNDWIAHPR